MTEIAPAPGAAPKGGLPAFRREQVRMLLLMLAFIAAYAAVGIRMGVMAASDPVEPVLAGNGGFDSVPVRGEIVDRRGRLLAANLPGWALYAHPREIRDPARVAEALAGIFPDLDPESLARTLGSNATFAWIKRPVTPRQKQAVMELGVPGLRFGMRDIRIYPAGALTGHLMGGVRPGREDVRYAELVGRGGLERFFDERLRDPALAGEPLRLSIDLTAQMALSEVLGAGIGRFEAKGGAAIVMSVTTGEIVAMVSLPDFDPNQPPRAFTGAQALDPRFNRAAQGTYELGSTFKVLTAAMALDAGLVSADTLVDTKSRLGTRGYRIRDMHAMPAMMPVTDIVVRSSNVGAARMAMMVGTPRVQDYLNRLGLFDPLPLELSEAARARPLLPPEWTDLSTMTISYGHGLAVTPTHLAAAYATVANGGRRVRPSLLPGGSGIEGEAVFSPETSATMLRILREVVERGTGRRANVPGYEVGGKTGTADKPRENGRGYYPDRVIATFASVFPTSDPQYVVVVTLDEPVDRSGPRPIREASRTAVPVAGEVIARLAPILGIRPSAGPIVSPVAGGVATVPVSR